jgi:gamma-glutamyltranspeptidase/glutathione hydrolase
MKKSSITYYLIFLSFAISNITYADQPVAAKHAMVVSEQRAASQAGIDILRAGGNAIDAAVAVGYALAVVNPCCGNIGGGGFMLIHFANGKNTVINFREKAPLKASKNMFLDASGHVRSGSTTIGYLAAAVPGTVMGLDTALTKYGTMTRKQVMAPAIQLAKEGYRVTRFDAKWFSIYAPQFARNKNVAAIFLKNGQAYREGDLLVQTDLANTLTLISEKGAAAFYKGSIAKQVAAASEANGGIMTTKDFAAYTIEEFKPLQCTYHDYTVMSVPPPSSGGVTLCEMLSILEHFPLQKTGFHTTTTVHDMVEAMRYGFHDRDTKLGDPDFVKNPITQLLSKKYTAAISQKIKNAKEIPHINIQIKHHEKTDTTHYSIMDEEGNAVAVTYTINGFFGAQVIADHTGFFLNDEMDDFSAGFGSVNKFDLLQSPLNDIAPGKRPLSSMTPTMVMKNSAVYMILGSPGGPRIITTVLQAILNVLDFGMNIQEAADASRFHFQGIPDYIEIEPNALSSSTITQLKNMGYDIKQLGTWSALEAILIDPLDKTLYGASDYRRPDGAALGY